VSTESCCQGEAHCGKPAGASTHAGTPAGLPAGHLHPFSSIAAAAAPAPPSAPPARPGSWPAQRPPLHLLGLLPGRTGSRRRRPAQRSMHSTAQQAGWHQRQAVLAVACYLNACRVITDTILRRLGAQALHSRRAHPNQQLHINPSAPSAPPTHSPHTLIRLFPSRGSPGSMHCPACSSACPASRTVSVFCGQKEEGTGQAGGWVDGWVGERVPAAG